VGQAPLVVLGQGAAGGSGGEAPLVVLGARHRWFSGRGLEGEAIEAREEASRTGSRPRPQIAPSYRIPQG